MLLSGTDARKTKHLSRGPKAFVELFLQSVSLELSLQMEAEEFSKAETQQCVAETVMSDGKNTC